MDTFDYFETVWTPPFPLPPTHTPTQHHVIPTNVFLDAYYKYVDKHMLMYMMCVNGKQTEQRSRDVHHRDIHDKAFESKCVPAHSSPLTESEGASMVLYFLGNTIV
jgi:hypothetical protein